MFSPGRKFDRRLFGFYQLVGLPPRRPAGGPAAAMTPTLTRGPSDTTLPGQTRRHVWPAPEVTSHSLFVLTAARLFLAPGTGPPRPEALAALEAGGDPAAHIGPLGTVIDLAAVRRVTLSLEANTLRVEYGQPGKGLGLTAVRFASAETADTVFGKLWRRLGDRVVLVPPTPDPWSVIRVPLAVMAGVLAVTLTLAMALSAAPDVPHPAAAHLAAAPEWADWRAVCGSGGAALAVVQVWLYRRLTRPPSRLVLERINP